MVTNNRQQLRNVTNKMQQQLTIIQELSVVHQLVAETQEHLHTLYDAVDQARVGKISSYLIKPNQFYDILQDIKSHLHVGDSLPITVTPDTMYHYYNIVNLIVYFKSNCLRYVLEIPLYHVSHRYHLFKVIQVPELTYNNNVKGRIYTFPEKTTEYLALSEDLQYYATPKEADLQQCTKPPFVICKNVPIIFPVSQSDLTHARCEVEIFKNLSSPNCNYRISKIIYPVWEQIPYANVWIFAAVPDNEVVTIACKNDRGIMTFIKDIKLHTKGKLTLEPNCMAVGSTFTLLSRDVESKEAFNHVDYDLLIPNLNITPSEVDNNLIKNFDNFSSVHADLLLKHVTHHMNDLNVASIRISKLRQLMKDYEPTNFAEDNHQVDYTLKFFVLIVIVLLLMTYVFAKCGILKCTRRIVNRRDNRHVAIALESGASEETPDAAELETLNTEPTPAPSRRRSLRLMRIKT